MTRYLCYIGGSDWRRYRNPLIGARCAQRCNITRVGFGHQALPRRGRHLLGRGWLRRNAARAILVVRDGRNISLVFLCLLLCRRPFKLS
jgi:hypothetical protein